MDQPVGYSHLVTRYDLPVLPLTAESRVASDVKGRQCRQQGETRLQLVEPKYYPDDTLAGHLQFALRYEGVNLRVLDLLFAQTGARELVDWIRASPESRYARVACHLYEWLSGRQLPIANPVSARASYVFVADTSQQLCFPHGTACKRFRVRNNLPGNRDFCPLIQMTPYLQGMLVKDLRRLTADTLGRYDAELLRRAAAYLYLKETQSSFELEREKPSPQKAQRFADLLREADTQTALTEERFVELQNATVDPRFHEFTWRGIQNWIGKDLGYRKQVDFVPPRPADVPSLMQGLLALAVEFQDQGSGEITDIPDPVLIATAISFGFVFIHPFKDGNGRIHRYLIHDVLAKAGFTPRGIVLPVSAVILANLDEYIATLEQFSRPLNRRTAFDPDHIDLPATGNDAVYFRYPDLTAQAEFLYKALERTVTEDLGKEIDFLLGFDQASKALNHLLDWPGHSLELFIRVVRDNGGTLSSNKRKSHFEWMREDEIKDAETLVNQAFAELHAEG